VGAWTGRLVGSDGEFATINDRLRGRLGSLVESSYQLGGDGGFGGFSYPAGGGGIGLFFNTRETASSHPTA
jgi:hypothetical protein